MISVLIPTRNEEINLPDCLKSLSWTDDIHVYDNGSTDKTAEISRNAGVTFWKSTSSDVLTLFGGDEAKHRNWALHNITFKYEWVFLLDADERISETLARNLQNTVRSPGENVAFFVQRRDFYMNRWLKHVQATPFYMRLFRPQRMTYKRMINPVSVADGPTATIDGYLDHFPFSKGIIHWLDRHNSYSTLEALQIEENHANHTKVNLRSAIFSRDKADRRLHQKELFYRMPARPFLKFMLLYFVRCGFLDGRAGFTYAILQFIYEYMIVLKTREIRDRRAATLTMASIQEGASTVSKS